MVLIILQDFKEVVLWMYIYPNSLQLKKKNKKFQLLYLLDIKALLVLEEELQFQPLLKIQEKISYKILKQKFNMLE